MRATANIAPTRLGKRRLLESCAIMAGLAALAHGGPAMAQVAGSGTITALPGGTTTGTGVNPTTVNTTGAQTIIDWTPSNAPVGGIIDFLPSGNTLTFTGTGQYIVLNRFVSGAGLPIADQIAINGTVNGIDFATSGGRGGNIWFYNAGGILIGATGVINVGSLVLTANDVLTTGGLLGPSGEIRFRGAAGGTSNVTVAAGAAINADNPFDPGSSYVALVAPRIVQAGAVRVDGSAAYVAAEQADIRINNGLFDINVLVGAEGGNVITHSGTTTGPAHQQGDIDQSRIYMVAIPKNDAVTMLVSGQVGYDDAVTAQTDPDGAVVLSAGYNVVNGQIDGSPVGNAAANITVNDTIFRSDTTARASGAFLGQPLSTIPSGPLTSAPPPQLGRITVQGNALFIGDAGATINVNAGRAVSATGDMIVRSGGNAAGPGTAAVNVTGGAFGVLGDLVIEAGGIVDGVTGDSEGGNAGLAISGGAAQVGGLVTIAANAIGGDVSTQGSTGGSGRAGSASLVLTGGTFTASDITVSADGFGGDGLGTGGLGIGGTATIDLLGGTIDVADLIASASGTGGQGLAGNDGEPTNIIPGGVGGVGAGGQAAINIDGATVQASLVAAYASGQGGEGGAFNNIFSFSGVPGTPGDGGTGNGGSAAVNVASGTLDTGSLIVDAAGIGGQGGSSFFSSSSGSSTGVGVGGTGGTGQGGVATLALATAIDAGSVQVAARGQGGAGGLHNVGGNGGDAGGGLAQMIVSGFNAGLFFMNLDASATGGNGAAGRDGNGGNGGSAVGGTASAVAEGTGGRFEARGIVFATAGRGGNGGAGGLAPFASITAAPDGGDGGNGTGGIVELFATDGGVISLTPGSSGPQTLGSNGFGGIGGQGANHFGAGRQSGDGGDAGAGSGGVVRLIADGGTITTTQAVTITVQGVTGSSGGGGTGFGGATNGVAGASAIASTGGRAVLESASGGLIALGNTIIDADGDLAGRIELRTDENASSSIAFTTLAASALGEAAPTGGNIEEALTGIFVAVDGGAISTTGDATLETGSAVGAHARSSGRFSVGGNLLIEAGERFDVRHDARSGTAATIGATGDFTITAPQGIFGTPGSLLGAGGDLTLSVTAGPIQVDALDSGNDIVITAAGAVSVEHAEAVNDFTASGASFRTGLNSIITGGDILITSPGAVDLGNSTAGGFVQVNGQSILFNNIDAGASVSLTATGNAVGAQGISGGSIDAGGNINLNASLIAINGTLSAGGSLFANGSAGPVAIALANVEDNISIFATGDITGTYNAVGSIQLTSGANISASANATGFESSSSGTPIAASVFIDAGGDVVLTNNSATGMFAVRAGGAASVNGVNAGEDALVLAGTTAALTNITAGDDLTVTAPGGIVANGVATTGTGPDNRTLIYGPFSPSGPSFFQINSSPPNQSNIALTASAGTITGGGIDAFDNLTLTASGAVATTGTLASGLATRIEGSSISFAAIDAGSTVDLLATNAITGATIAAGGDINLIGDSVGLTGAVTGDASFFAFGLGGAVAVNQADVAGTISIFADGNLTGSYVAGGDVRLNSNANIDVSATANGGYVDANGVTARGNLFAEAAGNVVLANSAAARMFGVSAGGSATIAGGNAGEDMLVLAGTTASLSGITAGDDVDVRAGGDLTANGVNATGAGADTAFLSFVPGSGFTINSGEGISATDGSDVRLTAGGSIGASALSAGDDIFAATTGAIAINGATTFGLGATGGSSNIRTQGGDTTLAALNAFTDVLVTSTGTMNATGPIAAGRDVTITASSANLESLATPGGTIIETVSAGNNLSITTSGDIVGGRVRAGGDLTLTGSIVDITRAQTTGTGQLTLTGASGVNSTNIQAGGATLLNASNGAVTSDGLISTGPVTATGNSINLRTGGNIVFAVLDADVGDAVVTNGSGTLTITSSVVAGRTTLTSENGNDIVISALAADATDITSEGDIVINGVLTARNIALRSNDIIIASGARVGTAGSTEGLSIENNDVFSQTFVGGTGTRNGFHLDASELTRLFGTDIEVFAPEVEAANSASVGSSAPPDIIVDSFTIAGGAAGSNLGANGALTIRTPGKMRVIGNVQLTGLSDTNALNLFADDALEVILGQGTVRLVNGTAAAGQLNMVSDDIIVATTAAINDVGAATTTDAIEARLAQNDGVLLDEGSLFARGIRAEVIGGFYVQNSGTGTEFANRRGLTFGGGGLDVLTEGTSRIVINGVQISTDGQVTGLDTVPLLTIGGSTPTAGSFDPRSTFNGCLIGNVASCSAVTFDFENSFPVQDVIEEAADAEDEDGNGQSLPVPLITMRDLDPLSGEPLLDDPVTGAGNDDLWTPTLDECDPAGTCPAAE
ncbi:MAG TPA: hypothetical protein VGN68_09955 [Sphingopyxis sp.]|jgi:hypothetical protein|uniref:hypothetical protein n=1 Tax=Sphingopyxis sp. TaxID=1908224 RepID=UPI002E164038|nr:hypothetical protein [Sphingopyxis sp.]